MGHYASEMDPNWGAAVDHSFRLCRLKKKLANIPLSKFRASDVYDLRNLFSVVDSDRVHEETLVRFEKIAGLKK